MNETEQFLKDLESEQGGIEDIFNQPLNPEPEKEEEKEVEKEEDEDGFKPKNRRERRQQEKIAQERASSIQLAERLSRLEEAKQVSTDDADYLKGIERIYGTDSPEAQMATEILTKAFKSVRDDAENRAYERIQAERQNETQAVQQAESELDSIVDDIEDQFGIELTEAQETAYFQLLQKMSPKDREGNVTSLADPYAVFELFQEKAAKDSTLTDDATERWLRENAII
jgi:hypothetical protein